MKKITTRLNEIDKKYNIKHRILLVLPSNIILNTKHNYKLAYNFLTNKLDSNKIENNKVDYLVIDENIPLKNFTNLNKYILIQKCKYLLGDRYLISKMKNEKNTNIIKLIDYKTIY